MSKLSESSWIPNLGAKGWGVTLICVCFYFWLFGGFCGRDSGIGPAQRAKTTIWN